MDNQKNLILAIVVSCVILFGFQYFLAPKSQAPEPPTQTSQQAGAPQAPGASAPSAPGAATPNASGGTTPATLIPTASRESVLAKTPRAQIETPRLRGSINLVGGRIDDLTLLDYREEPAPNSPQIVLLAPDGTAEPYFAEFGWVAGDPSVKVPGNDTVWTSSGGALTPEHPIDLTWDNGAGLRYTRHYAVDSEYMFTLTQSVTNTSGAKVTLYPYALTARKGEVPVSPTYLYKVGPIGVFDGKLDNYKYSDMKLIGPNFQSSGGWIGFTDKYWLTALVPDQHEGVDASFRTSPTGGFQADFAGGPAMVAPGHVATITSHFFAGSKEVRLLDRYSSELGTPIERAIDWGWFRWFMKPIFSLLMWLYDHIGNFGIAIICLTIII